MLHVYLTLACQRVKRKQNLCIRYEVVSVMSMKTMVIWHVMLCSLLGRYHCSGGICIEGCLL